MRLSRIKLAGFKSFVDPTTIHFPSNLIGVVGPNGCGKSNVIDAVRWVMGEGSAKHLRGDSMADVIFNGSSSRKPVGSAGIELIFDNSDAAIGGQYASFGEVSIRREVGRDGVSNYFLNNTRCRRKDITHLFLGTGLGPRSYSIIEQGMISRLIEAKPEELRVYLEEAAGISKYKDRRRETENRIRNTRDNLDRLNDLREEVEKQIKHLQRQAKTAERFKKLKQDQRKADAELLALRIRELATVARRQNSELGEHETAMQAAIAEQRRVEADIETSRQSQIETNDDFNRVQARYYKVGAEIARLEQAIQHGKELRQRQQKDLEEARVGLRDIAEHVERDRGQLAELSQALTELRPALDRARQSELESGQALQRVESGMAGWQEAWSQLNTEINAAQQTVEVERTRIEHLDQQLEHLASLRSKLVASQGSVSIGALEEEFAARSRQEADLEAGKGKAEHVLSGVQVQISQLREQDGKTSRQLDELRARLQKSQGRLASLEALQQAALGDTTGQLSDWLDRRDLGSRPRLVQTLAVEAGWDSAVETVLGSYLQAVCVDGVDAVTEFLADLPQANVTFFAHDDSQAEANGPNDRLSSKVQGPRGLDSLLRQVWIAEDLVAARDICGLLGPGESVVTREGIWLSPQWVRVNRAADPSAGMVGRDRELRILGAGIQSDTARAAEIDRALVETRSKLHRLEETQGAAQKDFAIRQVKHLESRAALEACQERLAAARDTLRSVETELGDNRAQMSNAENRKREALSRVAAATGKLEGLRSRLDDMAGQRDALTAELGAARERADGDRAAAQEIAIQVESRRSTRDSAATSLQRMQSQQVQFSSRATELKSQLEQGAQPLADQENELEAELEQRVVVETELGNARRAVEQADAAVRDLEQSRIDKQQAVAEIREVVDEARLVARETSVRSDALAEQLATTQFEYETLVDELPLEAGIADWEETVQRLARRIDRLGPINLASIDELREQTERQEYLDAQFEDLNEALTTLENAIRRIDRETRTRFRDTFDQVNLGLKQIFPRLFGGGHAYLELTGDDLLTAGVTVMAQPPGKRNSNIHLLSGGEKALTAVALVFSIFELNPAPFCLLDEVDAPLDDLNVGRFCEIVRDMSQRVQFVIITHNKTTMEMASHLVGVTMSEPGVSRMVAVDIDEAVQLAAM